MEMLRKWCQKEIQIYQKIKDLQVHKSHLSYLLSDFTLKRYLNAYQTIDQAFKAWMKTMNWRVHFKIHYINQHSVKNSLLSGKAYYHKQDKEGNQCLLVFPRNHIPRDYDNPHKIRFAVWLLEKGFELCKYNTGKITVIWDVTGFKKRNNLDYSSFGILKQIIIICQEYYPQMLSKFIIFNSSILSRSAFHVLLKPYIQRKTLQKFIYINQKTQLLKYFDKDCLLQQHGGSSTYKYQYLSQTEPIPQRVVIQSEVPKSLQYKHKSNNQQSRQQLK